jgi:vacuolar protein sorting-associated protein 54
MPNNTTPTRQSIDNTRMSRTASGVKLAYLASSQQPFHQPNSASIPNATSPKSDVHVSPPPPPTIITSNASTTHSRPLARERPFARDENSNPNSRPPSIRSATSFGRPLGRFMSGQHTRHHSNYSNFSTMSETALPWTTRDIGFNAISGNYLTLCRGKS